MNDIRQTGYTGKPINNGYCLMVHFRSQHLASRVFGPYKTPVSAVRAATLDLLFKVEIQNPDRPSLNTHYSVRFNDAKLLADRVSSITIHTLEFSSGRHD